MIFRRRTTRIAIEYTSLKMEAGGRSPAELYAAVTDPAPSQTLAVLDPGVSALPGGALSALPATTQEDRP